MLPNLNTAEIGKNHTQLEGEITNRDVIHRENGYLVIAGELNETPTIEIHQVNWLGNNSDLYTKTQYNEMMSGLKEACLSLT